MDINQIATDFVDFPYNIQYEIALSLNVVRWDDANLTLRGKLTTWAKRIREGGKTHALENKIKEIKDRIEAKSSIRGTCHKINVDAWSQNQ